MIIIHATGPLALVQDLGRPGYAALGVSPAGAADRSSLRAANRLVGNPEDRAGIEITLGGLVLSTEVPQWCAVTGATTTVLVNGRPDGSHHSFLLRPGDRAEITQPDRGLRNYLAVRGGITVPPVLGSRSSDLLSGLGPAPLRPGDRLPVGVPTLPLPAIDVTPPPPPPAEELTLHLTPGPRLEWFSTQALDRLTGQLWSVGADSDRTAVRLLGDRLERDPAAPQELPSEGVVRGAVQVPPSGQPLIFGSNHPVTGGYPVIAVVTDADVDRAAQLRPGDRVRFRPAGAARLSRSQA